MTTRSTHDDVKLETFLPPQTLVNSGSPENIVIGDIDLKGFDSAQFVISYGDIDELGTSPVGTASVQVLVEHSDTAGSGYANVGTDDIDGATPASGVVDTVTDEGDTRFSYIGSKQFVRITLIPTGLSNGGPVSGVVAKAHAHLTPVS